jgi:hypothetical protein
MTDTPEKSGFRQLHIVLAAGWRRLGEMVRGY